MNSGGKEKEGESDKNGVKKALVRVCTGGSERGGERKKEEKRPIDWSNDITTYP